MSDDGRRYHRDAGFTVIEILIVVVLLGVVVSALAGAVTVVLKVNPGTELRIDDARSTRGLATWLSHDVASTPPFDPPVAGRGGFETAGGANACGAPASTNLLQLTWVEDGYTRQTHHVSYRLVNTGDTSTIARFSCSSVSGGEPRKILLTSGLGGNEPAAVQLRKDAGSLVTVVEFRLTGTSGETVIVDTSSRNPSEFFPT